MKRISLFLLTVAVTVAVAMSSSMMLLTQPASAVTATDWKAGRIIDDSIFTKKDAMSVAEIQNFLNTKVGTGGNSGSVSGRCDTNGTSTSELGGGTRAQYGAANGNPAPFTCLKDYYEVPKTSPGPGMPANNYGGKPIPSGAKSAAELIWDAAQRYNISPRVLLIKLHTESAGPLTSDDWPFLKQYRYAMGAHCPDSGPGGSAKCDENYAGFSIQISEAAALLRYYLDNMTQSWWSYKKPYQNNNILWNVVQTNCGGSNVYIENKATAALYTYTPYQPNQAALNNMYGTGDGCSAYGNRNFWRIFSDWYGGTRGADYAWSLSSQEVFTDSARTTNANTSVLAPNTDYYFRVRAINTGNSTWTNSGNNPVRLATINPSNRSSSLCNNTWGTCDRATTLIEASVAPGQTGTFEFKGALPTTGTFRESFNLVAEGKEWFSDIGFFWQLTALPPTARWQAQSQELYSDIARTQPVNVSALSPGTTYYAKIIARNIGNTSWVNSGSNPVRLGTNSPADRSSSMFDSQTWISPNRAGVTKEASVAPGLTGTFEFAIKTPSTFGTYKEYFLPVVEGTSWMNDIGFHWPLTVIPPTPLWNIISQQIYTDSNKTTSFNTSQTTNASRAFISIQVRNTGNTTWANSGSNPVRLGTSAPYNRTSEFYDATWVSNNRPALLKEASVAPGATGTFEFWITSPYKTNGTTMKEYFQPVVEGVTWMNDLGMHQPFTFTTASDTWEYAGQSAHSNANRTTSIDPSAGLARNTTYYLQLKAKNTSGIAWQQQNVYLGTSSPNDRISSFYDTSWISNNRAARLKESTILPGQTGTFEFSVKTPNTSVTANEYFRPVIEGVSWMQDIGLHWTIKVN